MRTRSFLPALVWAFAASASAADITGRVLSEGKGVVGATVSALPYETRHAAALREARGTPPPPPLAAAATSGDGRFKLVVPPTTPPFVVKVTFGGLAARTLDGVFEGSDMEDLGEVSLSQGDTVSGRVIGPDGKPVTGALVRIGRDSALTTTGKDGLFRFDDVSGRGGQPFLASSTLNVNAAGFEAQAAAARFSGSPVTVRLKPSAARFVGVLRDGSGRPATDAVVRVAGDAVTRWVTTDAAGRFEIPGVPAKQGRLQALGKDGSSLEIAVAPGTAAATFTLARAGTIEGRVTQIDNGRVVPAVKVTARASGSTILARTGVDGRYRIPGLPQGSYRLTFDEKRFVPLDRREVEVAAGETKTLDIGLTQAVTLVGRVSDEKGRPIGGARGALAPGSDTRMNMVFRAMAREGDGGGGGAFVTGPDGTFRATRLSPGTNQKLTVTHPDFERRVVAGLDLILGAPKPLSIEVVLSPGYVLAGVVKDKDGKPIEGAEVTLNQSVTMTGGRGGNMVSFSSIQSVRPRGETDFEGKFGFKGLSPGDYDVTVSKSGFTRSVTNGAKAGEGSTPLEVVLNPGASIAGRLIQPNGLAVTGYSITARPVSTGSNTGMGMGQRGNNFVQVDPDGGFLIEGLTPGTAYDLSIFGAGEFRGDPKKKGVVAPAAGIDIEVASRGRIAGRVLDAASGTPVTDFEASFTPARGGGGGIVVRMGTGGDGDRRTPFSSPEGAFAFEDVPPGSFDVTVWARTYQEARTGGVAVTAGETRTIEVKAARGLVIRGRVVDAKGGRGVQDATVSARAAGGANTFVFDIGGGGGGVVTDADGRFEIIDQAPGSYQVTARHTLFSEATARVTLEDKDGAVDIPMVSGGVIAGMVASSQGAPLSGAEVSLQNSGDAGGMRMGMDAQGTLTDGAGRFRFEHLAAGRYKVGATLRSEASPTIDVPLNAGDVREDIRLALDAGATVRGVVKGLDENERSGVMVGAQGSEEYFANTRTNADGSFEFTGVPKGSLTLRATAGDLVFGSSHTAIREVAIPAGQSEVLTEIVFEDGLAISGTVTRRGVPVSGARVSAFMTGAGRQASGRTDENGAFRITGLEPGRVNVSAFAEAFSSQASQIVELKADMSVDLVIPTAKLGGTVLDSASGLPLESTVELQRTIPAAGGAGGQMRMNAATDSSGRFGFEDLEPVEYRITARRSGYESVTRTVKPSESGEDLRLELKRGSGLSVEAKDAQMGFGLRGLFARVQEGTQDVFAGNVSLDGDGKGEIPGIPAGSYTVTAQASGYAPVRVPNVMAPSMVLHLNFTPGGAVEFQTTEDFLKDGPKSGQLVSLSGAPVGMGLGGPNSFRLARLTQRMENLSPGRYRLTLEGGIEKTFDITEGGAAIVTIP